MKHSTEEIIKHIEQMFVKIIPTILSSRLENESITSAARSRIEESLDEDPVLASVNIKRVKMEKRGGVTLGICVELEPPMVQTFWSIELLQNLNDVYMKGKKNEKV